MIIDVKWDGVDIVNITKKKNMYISSIVTENIDEVIKRGMSLSLICSIKVISKELPSIVRNRLPNINIIKKEIKLVSQNMESNILEYINSTKCVNSADKMTLDIKN